MKNEHTVIEIFNEKHALLIRHDGEVIIALGYNPKRKDWDQGLYYGNGIKQLKKAIVEVERRIEEYEEDKFIESLS